MNFQPRSFCEGILAMYLAWDGTIDFLEKE